MKKSIENLHKSPIKDPLEPFKTTVFSSKQLKIYNIMYNNFSYEHDVLCQKNSREFKEFDMEKSTPSILSEQSFSATNYCNFINGFT